MLKIDTTSPNGTDVLVTLAGWIRREHLPEIEQVVARAAGEGHRISLDLRDVSLVDREAVDFLAGVAGRDIELRACPTYLREWLKSVGRDLA
jgi:hypothetical protein